MTPFQTEIAISKLKYKVKCLSCRVAELEANGGGSGGMDCCEELQEQIDAIVVEIESLNGRVDLTEADISQLELDISAVQIEISNIEGDIISIYDTLALLQDSLITSTIQGTVNTYADLPDATLNTGEYWGVLTSTGTAWLPGTIGGTYRTQGIYYSNGTTWIYMGSFPYEATQIQVDAGIANDVFVTPLTLTNAEVVNAWKLNVATITTNTAAAINTLYLCDTSSGILTLTIDPATLFASGKTFPVIAKKITNDSNDITIIPSSGTIDGYASHIISAYNESVTIYSNGTNLYII